MWAVIQLPATWICLMCWYNTVHSYRGKCAGVQRERDEGPAQFTVHWVTHWIPEQQAVERSSLTHDSGKMTAGKVVPEWTRLHKYCSSFKVSADNNKQIVYTLHLRHTFTHLVPRGATFCSLKSQFSWETLWLFPNSCFCPYLVSRSPSRSV